MKSSLRQLGYRDSFAYSVGSISNGDSLSLGWRGRDSTLNLKDVIQRISVIKNIQSCPSYIYAGFERNGKIFKDRTLPVSLTRAIYPNGRCCRVSPPLSANTHTIYELVIADSTQKAFEFKLILSDQGKVFKKLEDKKIIYFIHILYFLNFQNPKCPTPHSNRTNSTCLEIESSLQGENMVTNIDKRSVRSSLSDRFSCV